ncbi:MAG TPA: S1 RNA-binding domain-containing protein, partial [Tepidisphaeraceae bacterium]
MAKNDETFKEKYRPPTTSLDQEVEAALGDLSIDDLYEKQAPSPARPAEGGGKGRRGRILSVTPDDAIVDLGGKSQGLIPMTQFETEPKVGEEYDFIIDRFDVREGMLILSRKGAAATNVTWESLEVGQIVEGTVTGSNKGGLEVDVKGMRAFMPAGQVDLYFNPDIAQMVGQRVKAEVTQFSRESRNLIISRRNVLEQEKEAAKAKLQEEIAEGQVRRGIVRNIMDFGAFIDLGGMDGLLHVSEMTFRRGIKPSEIVKIGDVLDVKILKYDREAGKISLSLNQARGVDPWLDASTKYAVGTQITGRVTKVESFGAFIEVEEGVEGLLPVSEISWQRVKSPSDVLKEGDTLRLVVL